MRKFSTRIPLFAALLIAFSLGAIVRDPPGIGATYALPHAPGDVDHLDIVYVDGSRVSYYVRTPATPTPTLTPTSSPTQLESTATPTPQNTPTVESTPAPTNTPGPTPFPKPTETPVPGPCWGIVTADPRLNVRDRPGVSGSIILGTVNKGDTLAPDAWALALDGSRWWRVWWLPDVRGYVLASYLSIPPDAQAACSALLEVRVMKGGLHLTVGAGYGQVMTVGPKLGILKGTDGTEPIVLAAKTYWPGMVMVWRNLYTSLGQRDFPISWGQGDPRAVADAWWSAQYAAWQQRGLIGAVDYFEVVNEVLFAGQWEVAFWLRTVENANRAGVCIAVFSDGYGNPQVDEFVQRRPVLDAMLAHPCAPGRYHAVALHAYEGADSGAWKFMRWRLFLAAVGTRYERLPWLFTEYGYALGTGPADCARFTEDWRKALAQYGRFDEVFGMMAYNVGISPVWTDLTGCLGAIG